MMVSYEIALGCSGGGSSGTTTTVPAVVVVPVVSTIASESSVVATIAWLANFLQCGLSVETKWKR